jgi:hypothetical protein
MDRPRETPGQEAERLKVEITGKEIIKKFLLQHTQPAEANELESDQEAQAGKTAKKNRKEKERRAKRKKEEEERRRRRREEGGGEGEQGEWSCWA